MTQSPQRVRAVARVGDAADGRPESPALLPRRRPGHLGPVHVIQLLLVEAALIAVVAGFAHGPLLGVLACGVALLVLVTTLARSGGRWWLERRLMSWQYRHRRHPGSAGPDQRLGALRQLSPGLAVVDVDAPDGAQVGVARDDAGWYAVATLNPSAEMRDDPTAGVPLDLLVDTLSEAGQPGVALQLVLHTVPATGFTVDAGSPVAQSYRQLLGQSGASPVPLDRATWIAVRVDARALAEAGADGGADLDRAPLLVVTLVRRVAKSLRRVGIQHQVLDAAGLLAALARSCDLDPAPDGGQPLQPREDWSVWHSATLAHRTFWLRRWPPLHEAGTLLGWLTTVPAALTSVSLSLVPDPESTEVDLRCLVRLAAPAQAIAHACRTLVRGVEQGHGELFPLDGEQGPAVYASAPTGGGPR